MSQLGWLAGCDKECYGFRGPPFPQKLFVAMDSPRAVIQWSDDGRAICVDAEVYERGVMHVHPGLVEIPSFANFRRQMREYGFDWRYHAETREFEFSHASFVRGRPDLLPAVVTRRKRRQKPNPTLTVGTRSQSASVAQRRSVIAYAGASKRDSDREHRSCVRLQRCDASGSGTAKTLDEITDDEWWAYCAPAIVEGMKREVEDVSGEYPAIENRFITPLFFCSDGTGASLNRIPDGRWTQKVLDFDEL